MRAQVSRTLPTARLSLKDRLSRLTFIEASKLLGPEGKRLIQQSGCRWCFKLTEDVFLGDDLFRLRFPGETTAAGPLTVNITLMAEKTQRLQCTRCPSACEHVGAALSLILEEKTRLGLAARPEPRVPIERRRPSCRCAC